MSCRAMAKWWKGLFGKDTPSKKGSAIRLLLAPLSVGLRVDISLSTARGRDTNASKLVWFSPVGSEPTVKALKILISPN